MFVGVGVVGNEVRSHPRLAPATPDGNDIATVNTEVIVNNTHSNEASVAKRGGRL
jgi:hypothetical protein